MSPLLRSAEIARLRHAETRWLEQARARLLNTRLTRAATRPTTDDGESR